jgi:hypothetical protein
MAAAEIQNSMFSTDRHEFTDEIHLTTRDLSITYGTGISEKIDLIEHFLPPIRIGLHTHTSIERKQNEDEKITIINYNIFLKFNR